MPRGGICNHDSCIMEGEGCRMLTEDELRPSEKDIEFGRALVADGWKQTSRKYRQVRRVAPAHRVTADELINPAVAERGAARAVRLQMSDASIEQITLLWGSVKLGEIEEMTLSVKQFAAFRAAEGKLWSHGR